MHTCLIVDDEPLAHEVLKKYISRTTSLAFAESFYNALDARTYLEGHAVDLIFLDIQMPEITGIDFIKSLAQPPVTIFTTAYRKYALTGFDLGVADYLLKPIEFERFELAVGRAIELLTKREPNDNFDLELKVGTSTILIDRREIIYAKGLKDYTMIFTAKQKYLVLGTLKGYEKILSQKHFIRVHKSYILARTLIKNIKQQKIIIEHPCNVKIEIPIGRRYKSQLDDHLSSKKQN